MEDNDVSIVTDWQLDDEELALIAEDQGDDQPWDYPGAVYTGPLPTR